MIIVIGFIYMVISKNWEFFLTTVDVKILFLYKMMNDILLCLVIFFGTIWCVFLIMWLSSWIIFYLIKCIFNINEKKSLKIKEEECQRKEALCKYADTVFNVSQWATNILDELFPGEEVQIPSTINIISTMTTGLWQNKKKFSKPCYLP